MGHFGVYGHRRAHKRVIEGEIEIPFGLIPLVLLSQALNDFFGNIVLVPEEFLFRNVSCRDVCLRSEDRDGRHVGDV